MAESHESRQAQGIEVSARRIERVIEEVRSELENTHTNWEGLSRRLAQASEQTREFARAVGDVQVYDQHDPLLQLFTLRQLEITLALISRLSGQIAHLQDRLADLERQVGRLSQQ